MRDCEAKKPRVGVSACLLGEPVRYDGEHRRDAYICDILGTAFEWIPVCPEMAIGMGVPRPPIHLAANGGSLQAIAIDNPRLNVTAALKAHGRRMALELGEIDGYIFKSRSPSCGTARVKIFDAGRPTDTYGVGIYAREIMARRPLLPMVEEGQLANPALRDNFIERVFAHRRWREFLLAGFSVAKLTEFHAVHKLSLMVHGAVPCRELGRLVANAATWRPRQLRAQYGTGFMAALQSPATPKRHANVLQHLMGYLKKQLDHGDKIELLELIDAYRLGTLPLVAPHVLLRHHFRRFPHPYVDQQIYLFPDPLEFRLRYNSM